VSVYSRPDWVIIGSRLEDQYVVWASRELDHIELQMIYDDSDPWGDLLSFQPPRMRYIELSGRLRSFVMVVGSSYADCLARLADFGEPGEWRGTDQPTPELPAFPELEAGPRALGPGGAR
jgi:hypothetical protein